MPDIKGFVASYMASDPYYKPGGGYQQARDKPADWFAKDVAVGDVIGFRSFSTGWGTIEDSLQNCYKVDSVYAYKDFKVIVVNDAMKLFCKPEAWMGFAIMDEYTHRLTLNDSLEVVPDSTARQADNSDKLLYPSTWYGEVSLHDDCIHTSGYRLVYKPTEGCRGDN